MERPDTLAHGAHDTGRHNLLGEDNPAFLADPITTTMQLIGNARARRYRRAPRLVEHAVSCTDIPGGRRGDGAAKGIFNPITQARKFDPHGSYIRAWIPELRSVPAAHIHAPHLAPAAVLAASNVHIDSDYPAPIVDLRVSRNEALAAYQRLRSGGDG